MPVGLRNEIVVVIVVEIDLSQNMVTIQPSYVVSEPRLHDRMEAAGPVIGPRR